MLSLRIPGWLIELDRRSEVEQSAWLQWLEQFES